MRRLIAPLALAAVALSPGVALAHAKTKVYKATFQYVGADGDYVTGSFGKAQLVGAAARDRGDDGLAADVDGDLGHDRAERDAGDGP